MNLYQENYRRYLKSPQWHEKRKAVLEAAGHQCSRCSATATEVHHETYERIYNEELSDLSAICRECHEALHMDDQLTWPRVCCECKTIQTDMRKYLIDLIRNKLAAVCHECYFKRTGLELKHEQRTRETGES